MHRVNAEPGREETRNTTGLRNYEAHWPFRWPERIFHFGLLFGQFDFVVPFARLLCRAGHAEDNE